MTSALDGVGSRDASAAFTPRERQGTHCTGGWVGPRAGLDRCGKSRPPPGFDPRTFQSVESRYTDWVIPAPDWGKHLTLKTAECLRLRNDGVIPPLSYTSFSPWCIHLPLYCRCSKPRLHESSSTAIYFSLYTYGLCIVRSCVPLVMSANATTTIRPSLFLFVARLG